MQVAIFEEVEREKLESAINEFLRINVVKVFCVTQSQSEGADSLVTIIISIFYEDE